MDESEKALKGLGTRPVPSFAAATVNLSDDDTRWFVETSRIKHIDDDEISQRGADS